MRLGMPRWIVVGIAGLFSAYVIVLGIYDLDEVRSPAPVIASMVIFALGVTLALLPIGAERIPMWMAALCLAVVVAITLLISNEVDLRDVDAGTAGYSTWYVAASGALLTIVCTRRRPRWAWAGVAFLVVHTILWAGPAALAGLGVIGSMSWVAVAHVISETLARANREMRRFALAEREAAQWQAAQEAHLNERQFRLGQTSVMALPMLRTIQRRGGELSPEQRAECLHLEGAIRDEIRGRRLLSDGVREQVMLARRRGVMVTLLDEGGIDELDESERDRVLARLAEAIRDTDADRVIARTVPEGSDVAVTVVGLRNPDEHARALGLEEEEDVALWLEIPRRAGVHEQVAGDAAAGAQAAGDAAASTESVANR